MDTELPMSLRVLVSCLTAASMLAANALSPSFVIQYKGVPYRDIPAIKAVRKKFPGGSCVSYYDMGGEGVAYHDTDQWGNRACHG
jgi:hypothetical protein